MPMYTIALPRVRAANFYTIAAHVTGTAVPASFHRQILFYLKPTPPIAIDN